jgi:MFS transporter, FHS family, glucose/mannose:H+ symporter
MLGMFASFWILGFFVKYFNWATMYWLYALLSIITLILLFLTTIPELPPSTLNSNNQFLKFTNITLLLKQKIIILFVTLLLLYTFVENGISTWLPTQNHFVLHAANNISIEAASYFGIAIAIGRLAFSKAIKFITPSKLLAIQIIIALFIILITIICSREAMHTTQESNSLLHASFVIYLLPLIGFFIAPIYPTLTSLMLLSQPLENQTDTAGLNIIFASVGAAISALALGYLFHLLDSTIIVEVLIIPLMIFLFLLPKSFTPTKQNP